MSKAFDYSYDVITPEFRVYIEGVQVPFIRFQISSGTGGVPQATVQVPAAPFLMEIARYYSPKVHIFYYDRFSTGDPYKILFNGLIFQVQYEKSTENNTFEIIFACSHRYKAMEQILLDYLSIKNPQSVGSSGSIEQTTFGSTYQAAMAMAGIHQAPCPNEVTLATSATGTADPTVCPTFLQNQFANGQIVGIPGIAVNLWQQIKQGSYGLAASNIDYDAAFFSLYKPLMEGEYYDFQSGTTKQGGLQFFQRLTGHAFLEKNISNQSINYNCGGKNIPHVMVPPSYYSIVGGSSEVEMVVRNLSTFTQALGDQASYMQILTSMAEAVDYDLQVLTSPILTSTGTCDTVIKPRVPFYYAPSCNIYYPTMYDSLNITYDEYETPTRVTAITQEPLINAPEFMQQFRSPPAWRTAIMQAALSIARNGQANASATLGSNFGSFSKWEQGKGIITQTMNMPQWLNYYTSTKQGQGNYVSTNVAGTNEALFAESWAERFGADDVMNPYTSASNLAPYQQMMMAAVDSFYTREVAKQRMGYVDGPFNPYIIPGYSMEILDSSPVAPSFHAVCVNVTHAVESSGSARTTVNFASAMSMSELANYYYPMISPWLQLTLGLVPNPSIVNNPTGLAAANQFYQTLGEDVFAAAPEVVFDFEKGRAAPVTRNTGGLLRGGDAVGSDPSQSYEGGLWLNFREIEGKSQIESAFGLKFIDLNVDNYSTTVAQYEDPNINADQSTLLSLGQNQYLDYVELNDIKSKTTPQ